ncbi:uncharacterized protein LOC117333929 [Pecten maximus]|uniref:uncharacterized protein LOC117333929 n=1 Tax=Pecten maximus TaxID=6579 RepID=UPI00145911B8|nr:uncharacterized protein LOC117333929 [Pecten maximus]
MDIKLILILILTSFPEGYSAATEITFLSNVAEVCGSRNSVLLPQGCDFSNTEQFCSYSHKPDGVWLIHDGQYPSGFAVNKIQQSPNGTYAVSNFNSLGNNKDAYLQSPQIESGLVCVEFSYSLQSFQSNVVVNADNTTIWNSPEYSSREKGWHTIVLAVNSSDPFQLQFKTKRLNILATVGIDAVKLWKAHIPTTVAPTTTTLAFEQASFQTINGISMEKILNADHFCRSYVGKRFGSTAPSSLITNVPEGEICIEFLYYLATSLSNIRVVVSSQSDSEDIWNTAGGQIGVWNSAIVGVKSSSSFKVRN